MALVEAGQEAHFGRIVRVIFPVPHLVCKGRHQLCVRNTVGARNAYKMEKILTWAQFRTPCARVQLGMRGDLTVVRGFRAGGLAIQ